MKYFLWYLVFLPFYLPYSTLLRKPVVGITAGALWVLGQVYIISAIAFGGSANLSRLYGFNKAINWNFWATPPLFQACGFQVFSSSWSISGFWELSSRTWARKAFLNQKSRSPKSKRNQCLDMMRSQCISFKVS